MKLFFLILLISFNVAANDFLSRDKVIQGLNEFESGDIKLAIDFNVKASGAYQYVYHSYELRRGRGKEHLINYTRDVFYTIRRTNDYLEPLKYKLKDLRSDANQMDSPAREEAIKQINLWISLISETQAEIKLIDGQLDDILRYSILLSPEATFPDNQEYRLIFSKIYARWNELKNTHLKLLRVYFGAKALSDKLEKEPGN